MATGPSAAPRDVDVVVDGASIKELEGVFQDVLIRKTRFGGLHLNVQGWMIDVWPLSETWALKEFSIAGRDFEALTRTTFLNVEAATISLSVKRGARQVHARGFFEAVGNRTLDINLEENPFPELAAVRTLITAYKLNYALSRRLARYVIHYTHRTPIEQLVQLQFSHYGFAKFNRDIIHSWARALRSQVGTQSLIRVPVRLPAQLPLWTQSKPAASRAIVAQEPKSETVSDLRAPRC
jgi:hypothetical protein